MTFTLLALLSLGLASGGSMDLAPLDEAVGVEPFDSPVEDEDAVNERTLEIARGLRCPVCQGMSVADSTTEAAMAMKSRISDLVRDGYSDEQIIDYFVARYDTWILLAPPRESNPLVYIGPGVLGLLGLLGVAFAVRATTRSRPPVDPKPAADDAYTQRVLKELDD